MQKILFYIFSFMFLLHSCQDNKKRLVPNNIIITWDNSFTTCCGDTLCVGKPALWYTLKFENKSDSILLIQKGLHSFFLDKKEIIFFVGGLEVYPNEKGIIELMEFIPRKGDYECDTSRYSEIRKHSCIKLVKKNLKKPLNDSIFYSRHISEEDKIYVPENLIIKKSKHFKLYPIGEYPQGAKEFKE